MCIRDRLATGDIHLVLLKAGLASASVPSKAYSVLAAGRPVVASVDPGSEVARMVTDAGAGFAVPPDDPEALITAVEHLAGEPELRNRLGAGGRVWAEKCRASRTVAAAYLGLIERLGGP